MFDFDNLKNKVLDSLNKAAEGTKDLAATATDKAKDVSRIAKLTLEINSEKEVIRKAYSEIGKLYYESHKDEPEGFFVQLCDEVTLALENIASKEAEIVELKGGSAGDDGVTVEFENVVSAEEDSCCDPLDFADAGEGEKTSSSEGTSEHPETEE